MIRLGVMIAVLATAIVGVAGAVPAGAPDPGYGTAGHVDVTAADARLDPVAILAGTDGSAVVLARKHTDTDHDAVVVRLTPAGAPDPAFGTDGVVTLPAGFRALDVPPAFEPYAATRGRPLAETAAGLLIAGTNAAGQAAVLRLLPDGDTDPGWDTDPISSDASAAAALAVRPDGEVLVAGTTAAGIFLAELSDTGTVTNGLDGDGIVEANPAPAATDLDRIVDLQLQASGEVVLARDVVSTLGGPDAGGALVLARYGTDGAVDPDYGPVDLGVPVNAARLAPQPGGGFVVAGGRADGAPASVRSLVVDADGDSSGVRVATWGTQQLRPAALLPQSDGSVVLAGARVDDGPRTASARLDPAGGADLRWGPGAVIPGISPVAIAAGDGRVTDAAAIPGEDAMLAVVARSGIGEVPLTVAKVSLNEAPTAALDITPDDSIGPSTEVFFDASGTTDPDGPTDDLTYEFDLNGDGSFEITQADALVSRDIDGPVTTSARVRATDALGRTSAVVTAPYHVGDGTEPTPTPSPTASPSPSPAPSPSPSTPFPGPYTILTPPTVLLAPLPVPLVVPTSPSLFGQIAPPVQVGGVEISPTLPRDGDRVTATFKVNVRGPGGSVCRVVVVTCVPYAADHVIARDGNVITVRVPVTASAPSTLARVRVTSGAGNSVEVPIAFSVRPPQTEPDYDIVGVEITQGVQRDTASARPAPPARDAPYDGVVLAGTDGEWGHPESFSSEVPEARIRVWVVAHGIRSATAPAPELYATLGRSQASSGGAVVRYGRPSLIRAPQSVPVTPETGLSPDLRADSAVPYVYRWSPDIHVPHISVRTLSAVECEGCPAANNEVTIRRPRVAVSRMRPTNVAVVYERGSTAVVPQNSPVLAATTPGHLRCLFGPGGNSTAESCEDRQEQLADEAPADGEAYRLNDRFFTGGTGPLAGLAPFVWGATRRVDVIVPPGTDAFTTALLSQYALASSGVSPTRATLALTAGCVATADGCTSGAALAPPLPGFAFSAPTAVVRDGGRFRLSGLARALHLAWGLTATGEYIGGHAAQIFPSDVLPVSNSAPVRAGCGRDDLRDLSGACQGLPTLNGLNGTWISTRRWEALLIGAREGNLPCPYRALDSSRYAPALAFGCPPPPTAFEPRPVDMSPFTARAAPSLVPAPSAALRGPSPAATRAATDPVPALAVTLRATGTTVTGFGLLPVASTAGALAGAATASGSVRFRAVDALGAVLAETAAEPQAADLGAVAAGDQDATASGILPALPNVARIEAIVGGTTVARRDRAGAPTVAIQDVALSADGARVAIAAADPDGDPLLTTVDVSTDGGATWRTAAASAASGDVTVPAALLPRSAADAGRLRVRVSDGFDAASATSGPLTFPGAPVAVTIGPTTRAQQVARGDATTLTAIVTGDPDEDVRWLSGKRRVGRGTTITLGALPVGRHLLRAAVGTARSAPVRVTVRPSPPLVTTAKADRQGCGAVRMRLATDDPVRVIAGGRRIGRLPGNARARSLRVSAPCRARAVRLRLVSSFGTRSIRVRLAA